MSLPQPLALLGFPPNELSAFKALFRLAGRYGPGYVMVDDPRQARIVIANADDVEVVRQLWNRQPAASVLLIGASDSGTGWPLQRRPIQLLTVLEGVRALGAPAAAPDSRPGGFAQTMPFEPSTMPAAHQRTQSSSRDRSFDPQPEFAATVPFAPLEMPSGSAAPDSTGFSATQPYSAQDDLHVARAPVARAPAPAEEAIDFQSIALWREARRAQALPPVAQAPVVAQPDSERGRDVWGRHGSMVSAAAERLRDDVLVVDEGDLSRRALERHLQHYGFRADLVRSGPQAVQQLALRSYRLVFVDELASGMSAWQTCRAIRRQKNADGTRPVVVLLSSRGGLLGKLQAWFAGCDVCLVKPLDETALGHLLASCEAEKNSWMTQASA